MGDISHSPFVEIKAAENRDARFAIDRLIYSRCRRALSGDIPTVTTKAATGPNK